MTTKTRTMTRTISLMFLFSLLIPAAAAPALAGTPAEAARADIAQTLGFVPSFLKALPDNALPGAWAELKQFQDGKTAIPNKMKDLIALAVAAQAGARSSVWAYSRCAQANGAS